jgi:hypothetical protein
LNGILLVVLHVMRRYDSWRTAKGLTIGSSDRGAVSSVSQGGSR